MKHPPSNADIKAWSFENVRNEIRERRRIDRQNSRLLNDALTRNQQDIMQARSRVIRQTSLAATSIVRVTTPIYVVRETVSVGVSENFFSFQTNLNIDDRMHRFSSEEDVIDYLIGFEERNFESRIVQHRTLRTATSNFHADFLYFNINIRGNYLLCSRNFCVNTYFSRVGAPTYLRNIYTPNGQTPSQERLRGFRIASNQYFTNVFNSMSRIFRSENVSQIVFDFLNAGHVLNILELGPRAQGRARVETERRRREREERNRRRRAERAASIQSRKRRKK